MSGRPSSIGRLVTLGGLVAAASCSSSGPGEGADQVKHGAQLFASRDLSSSNVNLYTCTTCHDATPPATMDAGSTSPPIKPGAALAGVTRRPSFWGGMESELLDAVDDCRRLFMNDRDALSRDDAATKALYAYLVSLEPGDPAPVELSVPTNIENVDRGDADRGQDLFVRSCGRCHGDLHTGHGRLASFVPVLPEDAVASHADYDARTQRLIFIEKTRHGGFFGYSGVMPPFSTQVLTDGQLSDVLETLGVTGGS